MEVRKKPRFHRQLSHIKKRSGLEWRRPRGKDSKQRRKEKERGARPNIGYRQPRSVRGLHPSGLAEVLIATPSQLAGLEQARHAVRIASGVGARKRAEIVRLATDRRIAVLNPGRPPEEKPKAQAEKAAQPAQKK